MKPDDYHQIRVNERINRTNKYRIILPAPNLACKKYNGVLMAG